MTYSLVPTTVATTYLFGQPMVVVTDKERKESREVILFPISQRLIVTVTSAYPAWDSLTLPNVGLGIATQYVGMALRVQ